jgi:membrane protease YdiL (CAAX protease family)
MMNTEKPVDAVSGKALAAFFLLAYAITWGLSVIGAAGLLPFAVPAALATAAAILCHYGPSVAAIVMAGIIGGRRGVGALFGRFKVWRVGWAWYAFVFLFPVALRLAAAGIDMALGGEAPSFFGADDVPSGNPLLLLPAVFLAVLFQAGLAEEIGWRGFGLVGLQRRFGALTSSLILSLIWGLWHFHPINFASLWPLAGWYFLTIIPFTVLMTWVFNNTGGSLLLAVLFHTASNVSDWIVPSMPSLSDVAGMRVFIIKAMLTWVAALVVVAVYGPARLSRQVPVPGDRP